MAHTLFTEVDMEWVRKNDTGYIICQPFTFFCLGNGKSRFAVTKNVP